MNANPNMPMNMGGPVGAPVPMMNNGGLPPQAIGPRQMQVSPENQRTLLNTYIYEYFIRNNMFDCARQLLQSDQQVNVQKDGNRRRDENGNPINGLGDDPMDTDSKDDVDAKLPEDLPAPKLPMPASETSFLYEWFSLFWDIFHAQRAKGGTGPVNQYVSHTQQQSRQRQTQQQDLLRGMRPDPGSLTQQQYSQMIRLNNGAMAMGMKPGTLARTAMANNQNPQAMQHMIQQAAKQGQMQREPSDMDGNRPRPGSPGSSENAPSPSKRPRLDGAPFNPNQPGMVPNGAPRQGIPGQQFRIFSDQPPHVQAKSISTYAQNLQQHQASQMPGNKPMPNAGGPPGGQGSPMMPQVGVADQAALNAYYNTAELGPGGIRAPGGPQAAGGGSNHALQDYQMQLMLLEQQNKKRLMMARQEQDNMGGGMPRPDGPAGPPGPNGQAFPETSPQGGRTGASPNPSEQMKRGTPQMNNAGIPSPLPEGAQSRGSPNPMNFMPNTMDPSMAPNFFNKDMQGMAGNMVPNPQMNGMRPPSSHPGGPPFNGQMNPQMMARQGQAGGNPQQVQWQQGPNGQMIPPGQPGPGGPGGPGQQAGTPLQRAMPPPSAPAAAAAANAARTNTSSPQQPPAPPTPSQANKAAPKKKETKNAKSKKKSNANLNAGTTPAADSAQEAEAPTPATPMTPVNANATSFNKNGQANAGPAGGQNQANAPAPAAAPPVPAVTHVDNSAQNGSFGMDSNGGMDFGPMDFANPLVTNDVLNDFDFDSFLHEDGDTQAFDFNGGFGMEGTEGIGAD
ncbi:SOM1 protein [Plectosphaerella cucumerina]|uniref:SOM1 protein n=1 Tax=Plectosphaerella cucumerina TaxID=40658 RepID=A0A8K0X814_9PEZI|nr:SOM1 protein [Plectosphaerella cucumerina]